MTLQLEPAERSRAGAVTDQVTGPAQGRPRIAAVTLVFVVGAALVVLLGAVDLTLGTSHVGLGDLVRLLTGDGDDETLAVLVASRAPRVLAGLLVGTALGVSGAVLQSVARNPLASPDTLAVNAGAYLSVVLAAVLGVTLPFAASGVLAFTGGLLAAGLVLLIARAGAAGPTRLVLAGSATMLALSSVTMLLMILFAQETQGMFAWGEGSIVQSGSTKVTQAAPVVVVAAVVCVLWARRLDVLALGDDTASVLGLDVRRTRVVGVLLAVLLAAVAVTVAGPVGFVGLSAPVIARLVAGRVRGLHRHRLLLPLSALAGCAVVLAADVLLRLLVPGRTGAGIPTGVVTTLLGAVLMVWLARRLRDSGSAQVAAVGARPASPRRVAVVLAVLVVALTVALVAAVLLGDRLLLMGDVANWFAGASGKQVSFVLDQRMPRVLAAVLAGAALGLAGTSVQGVARNPLAEPGLLGITGGAGVAAVLAIVVLPGASIWVVSAAACVGAVLTFGLVYGLSSRRGLSSDRLVLVGIGVSAAATSLITLIVVITSPWNTTMALTWLSGSTYGRTAAQVWPVAIALVVLVPFLVRHRRDMDVLALDDDLPRVLGIRLERTRFLLLGVTALLTAVSVSAVGVVGFVGLVAPHLARSLVGSSHARVVPVAALIGAVLLSVADTVGRTLLAPVQIPAGLVTAVIGAPYFVYLLWRTRRSM